LKSNDFETKYRTHRAVANVAGGRGDLDEEEAMRIAVIGLGNVGATLGAKLSSAGHEVTMGTRDASAERVAEVRERLGPRTRVETIAAAVDGAEAVIFAIPGSAMDETVAALGDRLAGRLVVDAANRIGQTLGDTAVMNSLAVLAEHAPSATVYRAFNSLGWENFAEPELDGIRADLLFAGPEGETRAAVEGLIADVGLRPVYVGGADAVPLVDALGGLWGALAFGRGMGRRLFFKVVSPEKP
jgi:predicted dinucleotide-binding enzyme